MGARVGCGRVYPIGFGEGDNTGPWVATSDGVTVRVPATWGPVPVLDWLKLHFPEALVIRLVEDDGTEYTWRFKGVSDLQPEMRAFHDRVCMLTYGRSRTESISKEICVSCASAVLFHDVAGFDEYEISGLCEACQEKVFGAQSAVQ